MKKKFLSLVLACALSFGSLTAVAVAAEPPQSAEEMSVSFSQDSPLASVDLGQSGYAVATSIASVNEGVSAVDDTENDIPQVYYAVLHDESGRFNNLDLYSSYGVSLTEGEDGVYDVAIEAEDLKNHQNAQGKYGYWVGFALKAPEGATQFKYGYYYPTNMDGIPGVGDANSLEANINDYGDSGVAFYFNVAKDTNNIHVLLQWLDADGKVLEGTSEYVVDFSDVEMYTFDASGEDELNEHLAQAVDGDIVKLTKNITLTDRVELDKCITLDGNGKTITGDTKNSDVYFNISALLRTEDEINAMKGKYPNLIIQNLKVKDFSNGIFVNSTSTTDKTCQGSLVLNNVNMSNFGSVAVFCYGNDYLISGCNIDCATTDDSVTIAVASIAADGNICGSTIVNAKVLEDSQPVGAILNMGGEVSVSYSTIGTKSKPVDIAVVDYAVTSNAGVALYDCDVYAKYYVAGVLKMSDSAAEKVWLDGGNYVCTSENGNMFGGDNIVVENGIFNCDPSGYLDKDSYMLTDGKKTWEVYSEPVTMGVDVEWDEIELNKLTEIELNGQLKSKINKKFNMKEEYDDIDEALEIAYVLEAWSSFASIVSGYGIDITGKEYEISVNADTRLDSYEWVINNVNIQGNKLSDEELLIDCQGSDEVNKNGFLALCGGKLTLGDNLVIVGDSMGDVTMDEDGYYQTEGYPLVGAYGGGVVTIDGATVYGDIMAYAAREITEDTLEEWYGNPNSYPFMLGKWNAGTVYIKDGYIDGGLYGDEGKIIITGGTFTSDPTKYVKSGCKVTTKVEGDETLYVVKKKSNGGGAASTVADSTKTDDTKVDNTKTEDKTENKTENKTEKITPGNATVANIGSVFDDVKNNDWYAEAVAYAYNNGLMNGSDGGFEPSENATRGQIVTILFRLAGQPESEGKSFSDIGGSEYYADAVAWAAALGVVNGYEDGTFAANGNVTREDLVTILYRFAQAMGYDTTQGGMAVREFTDYEQISEYALAAMQWAVNTGIINGNEDNTLNPHGEANRAEIAAMIMRFCEKIAK